MGRMDYFSFVGGITAGTIIIYVIHETITVLPARVDCKTLLVFLQIAAACYIKELHNESNK